jgi:hypothetical protein
MYVKAKILRSYIEFLKIFINYRITYLRLIQAASTVPFESL